MSLIHSELGNMADAKDHYRAADELGINRSLPAEIRSYLVR
jgi:hypothetical protein